MVCSARYNNAEFSVAMTFLHVLNSCLSILVYVLSVFIVVMMFGFPPQSKRVQVRLIG